MRPAVTGTVLPSATENSQGGSGDEKPGQAWPPLYTVVYEPGDEGATAQEYFPLEMSSLDYACRVLLHTGHVLREVYKVMMHDALAPPCLEDGRIVPAEEIDNKRLLAYALSAKAPQVFARVLKLDVDSFTQLVKVLVLAQTDMTRAPLLKFWTPAKLRRLFDVGLRIVEAAAEAGVEKWAALNLSNLRLQYRQHVAYREERLITASPHFGLSPSVHPDDQLDELWGAEENTFWHAAEPVQNENAKPAVPKDPELLAEMKTAVRATFLLRVEHWETLFGSLPPMETTKVGNGCAEDLRIAVCTRLKLMHDVNRTRELEARAKRQRHFKDAELLLKRLNSTLLPKLREAETHVQDLWKLVAPAELMDSVQMLERESQAHSEDAANARDYITARSLAEASERLLAARITLGDRKRDASVMEEMAARSAAAAVIQEDVRELLAGSNELKELDNTSEPPLDLLNRAKQLDLEIQKHLHKWTNEATVEETSPSRGGGSRPQTRDTARTSSTGLSSQISWGSDGKRKEPPQPGWPEGAFTSSEANNKQRIASISAMKTASAELAYGVKRLRWREKICGILRNVRDRTSPTSLQAELQTILEHDHGSTASSIASRLIASAADQEDSCLNVLRLMDDRHKLVEASKQEALKIGRNQHSQRKRWEGLGLRCVEADHRHTDKMVYVVFNGWYVREIGEWGTGDQQFRDPCGVAISPNGDFWVADRGNHRLHHFNASGKPLRVLGYRGKVEGQLENPSGVVMSPDGTGVFVADRGNDRVCIFNLDGACKCIVGQGSGRGCGQMQGPCGVAVRQTGELAVCDYGNNRVQIFAASDGDIWGEWSCVQTYGDNGGDSDRLLQPSAVCFDAEGRLVVADQGHQRVVVYGENGKVCQELKGAVNEENSFNGPSAVGVGGNGDIVVADQGNHRVQVFSKGGLFLRSFGFKGHDLGRLYNPRGLALGPNGEIAVADYGNHRIVVAEVAER